MENGQKQTIPQRPLNRQNSLVLRFYLSIWNVIYLYLICLRFF